jgi:hypothetical protein
MRLEGSGTAVAVVSVTPKAGVVVTLEPTVAAAIPKNLVSFEMFIVRFLKISLGG